MNDTCIFKNLREQFSKFWKTVTSSDSSVWNLDSGIAAEMTHMYFQINENVPCTLNFSSMYMIVDFLHCLFKKIFHTAIFKLQYKSKKYSCRYNSNLFEIKSFQEVKTCNNISRIFQEFQTGSQNDSSIVSCSAFTFIC